MVRHEVHYLAPLTYRFRPVSIECWVTEIRAASFTMAYEIFHETRTAEGGRRVYLRATTVLTPYVFATERPRRLSDGERETLAAFLEPLEPDPRGCARRRPAATTVGHYPVHVRFSDVDVYGHVNNVKYFEYFQEARHPAHRAAVEGPARGHARGRMVVAQTDVDYKVPILFRPEPYDAWSWLTRVGEPVDDDRVGDLRRRHRAVAGAGRDGLLRPGDAALGGAAARGTARAARGARPVPRREPVTRGC